MEQYVIIVEVKPKLKLKRLKFIELSNSYYDK